MPNTTTQDATTRVADAIRDVTAKMQEQLDTGRCSRMIDAEDVIDVLLSIADRIDPPFDDPADS